MAFLDDLYVLLPEPARARTAMDLVTGTLEAHTGIAANLGKTRVFNYAGGPPPPGVADLGLEVWRGDKPPQERGFVALGTPIGTPEYVRTWGVERLEVDDALLRQLPCCPTSSARGSSSASAQRHWQTTRLRTVPPDLIAPYAAARDAAIWGTQPGTWPCSLLA